MEQTGQIFKMIPLDLDYNNDILYKLSRYIINNDFVVDIPEAFEFKIKITKFDKSNLNYDIIFDDCGINSKIVHVDAYEYYISYSFNRILFKIPIRILNKIESFLSVH